MFHIIEHFCQIDTSDKISLLNVVWKQGCLSGLCLCLSGLINRPETALHYGVRDAKPLLEPSVSIGNIIQHLSFLCAKYFSLTSEYWIKSSSFSAEVICIHFASPELFYPFDFSLPNSRYEAIFLCLFYENNRPTPSGSTLRIYANTFYFNA